MLKVPADAARSAYKNFEVVIYAFARDADIACKRVRAQIVRVGIRVDGVETLAGGAS